MIYPTRREENQLVRAGYSRIAGIDEAGRGAWAGPLVAAAVILSKNKVITGVRDSKKLTQLAREKVFEKIIKNAKAYHVQVISRKFIDTYGIQKANMTAIRKAALGLTVSPNFILVDSFPITWRNIKSKSIIRGDAHVMSIAAASIVAKVTRDRLMVRYHRKYPVYSFCRNKGYGTESHRTGLARYGICQQHRLSYKPIQMYRS